MRLHAIRARALAAHGYRAEARAAITAAERVRADSDPDELHEGLAGEFAFDDAKLFYYEALSLVDGDDPAKAEDAAEAAVTLYQAVPVRARSYGCEALARAQLAKAQLMNRQLDDAAETLSSVLALDPQMRIGSLNDQLETCRRLLRVPAYRSSATARQLEQRLAAFSTVRSVQALPGGQ